MFSLPSAPSSFLSTSTSLLFSVESLLWQKPTNFNLDDSVWDCVWDCVCMCVPFPVVLLPLSADEFCLWSEQWRLQMFHRDRTFNLGVCVNDCCCCCCFVENHKLAALASIWGDVNLGVWKMQMTSLAQTPDPSPLSNCASCTRPQALTH